MLKKNGDLRYTLIYSNRREAVGFTSEMNRLGFHGYEPIKVQILELPRRGKKSTEVGR